MSLVDLQRQLQAVCINEQAPADALEALGDTRIFTIYRNMVRRRFYSELKFALKNSYEAAGDEMFQTMFNAFIANPAVRTRFFYRIPVEFSAWLQNQPALFASAPVYLQDLLAFEAGRWETSDLPDTIADDTAQGITEFSFDHPAVLNATVNLVTVCHTVEHSDSRDQTAEKRDVLFFRAANNAPVQFFRVNGVTADILRCIQDRQCSVGEAARQVTEVRKLQMDSRFVDGLCGVLADFLDRGVIVGSRAPT